MTNRATPIIVLVTDLLLYVISLVLIGFKPTVTLLQLFRLLRSSLH